MDGELRLEDDLFLDPGGREITKLPELRTGIIGRSTHFSLPKFGGFTTLKQACNPKGAISNSNIIIFQPFFWLLDVFVFDSWRVSQQFGCLLHTIKINIDTLSRTFAICRYCPIMSNIHRLGVPY